MNLSEIDLNKLNIFRELALSGSFTKTAQILKSPKSRISRVLSSLEKDLGVQLIQRTTRQFQLTEAGVHLSHHLNLLMKDLSVTLEQTISQTQEISGLIRVTCPEDISTELMGKFCREFSALYPKIHFMLYSSNDVVDLVSEKFDVAIRIGKSKDSTMVQKSLGRIDLSLVLSPELLKGHVIKKFEDLHRVPYLTYEGLNQKPISYKMTYRNEVRSLKLNPIFSCNNFFLMRQLALNGTGMAYIPNFLVRDHIQSGALVSLFKEWRMEGLPIQIVFPSQKEMPARVRKFIDFITPKLMNYF